MRGVALLSILLAFALAGCAEPAEDDWEPYDSGRGLAFGMLLMVLLIVGVVMLIVNLTASRQAAMPPPPPVESVPPPTSGSAAGWEPIEPGPSAPAPMRRPTVPAKRAAKPGKPRRPAP